MTHFALQSYKKTLLYLLLYISIAIGIATMVYGVCSLCFTTALTISLVYAIVFAALTIPLWMVVQFVEPQSHTQFQNYINIGAAFIVFQTLLIGITSVVGYGILNHTEWLEFVPIIPILLALGILGFGYMYQTYRIKKMAQIPVEKQLEINEPDREIQELQTEIVERISVKHGQKIHVIPVETIQYLQAEGDYVMIYTNDAKYLKEQTMKYFESHLSHDMFVRIHRSYIVNIHSISNVQLYEKQQYIITLRSGLVIKASAGGYKLLKQRLQL